MSIFKNANESAYVGGRKHWVDVIKNEADGELLIWRHPAEDFNTGSTLVVMPGEKAIFVKGGVIEAVFDNLGSPYKLTTENYPVIGRLRNAFSGGVSAFNCVVYYVREAHSKEVEWGTMTPIQYMDRHGLDLRIKGGGSYKVSIANPQIFLSKMIGNNVNFETQEGLNEYFANQFQQHIVEQLSDTLRDLEDETHEMVYTYVNKRTPMVERIKPKLSAIIANYGLTLQDFNISRLKIEVATREVQKMIMDKMAMSYMKDADVNAGWQAQQQMDILHEVARNPSAGGVAALGAGIGMGMGTINTVGQMVGNQFSPAAAPASSQPNQSSNPLVEKLKQLKELLDMGLISPEDFESKKQQILSSL